jgi:hypothetical protein
LKATAPVDSHRPPSGPPPSPRPYEFYERELKPLGYRARVEIIDYPGGVPGNIGMFLK